MNSLELSAIQPRYMWLDPASGKPKQRIKTVRARSAIVVVGKTTDSRIWALDAWADRSGTTEIVKHFVDMCAKWGPVVAGFEDAGQQFLLAEPIMEEAAKRDIEVPLAPVTVPTKVDKTWRIRTILQPVIGSGRLMIRHDLLELRNEITQFPMSVIKDLVDALASAVALVPPPAATHQHQDEVHELARYLRESGVPPSEIERAVQEAGGLVGHNQMPEWQRNLSRMGHFRETRRHRERVISAV